MSPGCKVQDACFIYHQFRYWAQECLYMECNYAQIWTGELWAWAAQPAKLTVPIRVNGTKVRALVYLGCAQIIIRKSTTLKLMG